MILLILAGIWAVVLIPPILRARAESSSVDSISDFRRQLRVLQRTGPSRGLSPETLDSSRYPETAAEPVPLRLVRASTTANAGSVGGSAVPARASAARARTIRRRRDVMFTLLMGMGTTFVLAMVISSSALWMLHLIMDGLFLGFVAMLVRIRSIAAEKEMKLRILPQPAGRPQPVPVMAMRRSATN